MHNAKCNIVGSLREVFIKALELLPLHRPLPSPAGDVEHAAVGAGYNPPTAVKC